MTDTPQLRDRIAEALMLWAQPNHDPRHAAIRLPETVTRNAYSRADAVLAVVQPELDAAIAEIDQLTTELAEGIGAQTMLKGLNVVDGQVHLEVEPAREMLLIFVASVRALLDDAGAKNYIALDLQDGQHPEDAYTLTLQRRYRPTAHEFREQAERERDESRAELARVNDALRAAGIEYPLGAQGVRDLAAMANGRAEELATARAVGMREAAAMLRKFCPTHGAEDTCFMDCHCAGADEIDRDARKIAPPAPTPQSAACPCRAPGQDGDGRVRYQARDGEFVNLPCRSHVDVPTA